MILIPAGAGILLALVLLLTIGGFTGIQQIARRLPLRIPIINYDLGAAVAGAIGTAVHAVIGWLWEGITPAIEFLQAPFILITHLITDATSAVEATVAAAVRVEHRITAVWTRINRYVASVAAAAVADVTATRQWAVHAIASSVAAVEHRITAVWTRINRYVASVEHGAAQALSVAVRDLDHEIVRTATAVNLRITAYVGDIDREVARIGDTVTADVTATREWAAQSIDTVRDDLTQRIDAERVHADDIVAAAEALLGGYLATTIAPTLAATATEVDDCVRPNCDQLKTLGAAFGGLSTLITLGVVGAFIVEAVEQPTAVARDIVDVGSAVIDAVSAVVHDVSGV